MNSNHTDSNQIDEAVYTNVLNIVLDSYKTRLITNF